jgi:hypothetical protein
MKRKKRKEIQAWIMDYLNGNLSPSDEASLFRILKEEGYDPDNLKELEDLNKNLDDLSIPEPSEQMHKNFYNMLEEEKSRLSNINPLVESILFRIEQLLAPEFLSRVVYVFLLIFAGWTAGYWIIPNRQIEVRTNILMNEIREMRETMTLTLLQQSKATERLKAISYTNEVTNPDIKVIMALLNTLDSDQNINVRLASLDALVEYADNPVVREGMIRSIANQDSPLVQIALADIMIALQEKRSIPELKKLLEKEDLNETVRTTLEQNIQTLI